MFVSAETLAGNGGYVGLAQQSASHIRCGLNPAASEASRDIRVGIERAFGQCAAHTVDGAKTLHYMFAELYVLGAHIANALLRTVERRYCGLLNNRSWIRRRLALQLLHCAN